MTVNAVVVAVDVNVPPKVTHAHRSQKPEKPAKHHHHSHHSHNKSHPFADVASTSQAPPPSAQPQMSTFKPKPKIEQQLQQATSVADPTDTNSTTANATLTSTTATLTNSITATTAAPLITGGQPTAVQSIVHSKERRRILFATKIGSGSEEQLFATQLSLSKTESLCSQLSEQVIHRALLPISEVFGSFIEQCH